MNEINKTRYVDGLTGKIPTIAPCPTDGNAPTIGKPFMTLEDNADDVTRHKMWLQAVYGIELL